MIRKLIHSSSFTSIALAAAFVLPLTGCPQEKGPLEKMEDTAEEAGDRVEDAVDKDGPIEEAAESVEDAAEDLKEGVEDAGDEMKN